MLRSSARHRPPHSVTDERRLPHLTLIPGGLLYRKEKDSFDDDVLASLIYVCLLRSWIEGRRKRKPDPEIVDVHEPSRDEPEPASPREVYEAFIDRMQVRDERHAYRRVPDRGTSSEPPVGRSLHLSKKVLRQYVRVVLGHEGGLDDYVHRRTLEALDGSARGPYDLLYDHAFERLKLEARAFARSAETCASDRRTRRGYAIHRINANGSRFVVTIHHTQAVVVGIYTENRFDGRRRFASTRMLSHRRAQAFRRNKPSRCCR